MKVSLMRLQAERAKAGSRAANEVDTALAQVRFLEVDLLSPRNRPSYKPETRFYGTLCKVENSAVETLWQFMILHLLLLEQLCDK